MHVVRCQSSLREAIEEDLLTCLVQCVGDHNGDKVGLYRQKASLVEESLDARGQYRPALAACSRLSGYHSNSGSSRRAIASSSPDRGTSAVQAATSGMRPTPQAGSSA